LGQTDILKRAGTTPSARLGFRNRIFLDKDVKSRRRALRETAQFGAELHGLAPARAAVVEHAERNGHIPQLLHAERLGAKLHIITMLFFGPTALVFDGHRSPESAHAGQFYGVPWRFVRIDAMELHHIGDPDKAKAQ